MAIETSAESPLPLARVTSMVKGWVERLGEVWVEGQVIQVNRRPGSTQYLTLRDNRSETSATLTCGRVVLQNAGPLEDGSTVVARVRPRVWDRSTSLSFECFEIRPQGEGQLLARLAQLRSRLQAEGLFDAARKKPLPFVPRRIGLVTGADSDAERDVLQNTLRRWPSAVFEVRHTPVQGPQAAEAVIEALRDLHRVPEVDVVVIARGGGSLEDLLAFSDEGLVRAVAKCRWPVVSAIGHEKDNPILDNVADLRASTPTDAAKRIVPDAREQAEQIAQARERLHRAVWLRLEHEQRDLDALRQRPVLRNPLASFEVHADALRISRERLLLGISRAIEQEGREIGHLLDRARTMSPKRTLERGYAILTDGSQTVSSIADVDEGDDLMAYVADGTIILEVRQTEGSESTPDQAEGEADV